MTYSGPSFELWLETETGVPLDQPANSPRENFCNITFKLEDGRTYALNVWTFDFLPLARYPWPYEATREPKPANYVLPPDLFVQDLTRETITSVIEALIMEDELQEHWLVPNDA